jgi:hypothetical protein
MTDNYWGLGSRTAVSCPQARVVKGRKANLKKIWSGKEWKAAKEAFLKENPFCEMHAAVGMHEDATIPHHPYRNSYQGHYTDLELSQCVAYCKKCHFAVHHGRKLCPVCGEKYPRWDAEMCWSCFCLKHPEVVQEIEENKVRMKAKQKELREGMKAKVKAWKLAHPVKKGAKV